jgi:hypothetical protein
MQLSGYRCSRFPSLLQDLLEIQFSTNGQQSTSDSAWSKTVVRPASGSALAFKHVSFATLRVQGPSEQTLIDLRVLSIRSALGTSVNIEPLKGEYR